MRKIAAVILIVAGIVTLSFPKMREMYYESKKKELLNVWKESMAQLGSPEDETNIEKAPDNIKLTQEQDSKEKERQKYVEQYIKEHIEGVIKIDSINLYQPVLKGATKENLDISVASVEETGKAGEVGNYCIAGHRNRTYGRNFNRLGEMKNGDVIEIIKDQNTYRYLVFDISIVSPEDVSVLKGDLSESLITLVTCEYSTKPISRLIVKGRLIK